MGTSIKNRTLTRVVLKLTAKKMIQTKRADRTLTRVVLKLFVFNQCDNKECKQNLNKSCIETLTSQYFLAVVLNIEPEQELY